MIKRLTSVGDGSSLDEQLNTKSSSELQYKSKQNKNSQLSILYRDGNYYFWKNKYSLKSDLRKDLVSILVKDAILLDEKEDIRDSIETSISFDDEKIEKTSSTKKLDRSNLKKKHDEVIRDVEDKVLFWSNPKIQSIPLGVGGTGLVAATLLPGGLGFAAIVAGGAVLFMGGDYIGKKIDKYKLKLEKLKKIHY